jgi:CheY-like chemotaxis protein
MIPALGRDAASPAKEEQVRLAGAILVVDESLPVRLKMAEILGKIGTAGEQLLQATTGEEALAAFRAHHPSIIFAELIGVHPEDGLDVLHQMLEEDPAARIVLMTAEPRDSAEVRAAIRAGVVAYVEKPLRHEKIRAVLADLEAEEGGIERFR